VVVVPSPSPSPPLMGSLETWAIPSSRERTPLNRFWSSIQSRRSVLPLLSARRITTSIRRTVVV
jgi:hypothetical protein